MLVAVLGASQENKVEAPVSLMPVLEIACHRAHGGLLVSQTSPDVERDSARCEYQAARISGPRAGAGSHRYPVIFDCKIGSCSTQTLSATVHFYLHLLLSKNQAH